MGEIKFKTSGSTGDAKQIVRSESQLADDARALVAAFPEIWSPGRVVVSSVPPEHMYGALWRVRAPAVARVEVDAGIVNSVEELLGLSRKYGRIIFVTTPSFLERALCHPDFPALKGLVAAITTAGSQLRRETAFAVAEAVGVCPLEIFGSTETGSVAFRRQSESVEWSVFDGIAVATDEEGRLVVDSPFAMARPFVMQDKVRLGPDGRFTLLGRADRQAKVLEKYVSLEQVENEFLAHPFVAGARAEIYGDDVPRVGVLVVLAQSGREELARKDYSSMARTLRRDLISRFVDRTHFPRRMRFVHRLPVDERGKTTSAAARNMLGAWCQEPVVLKWNETADELSAKIVFPPDSRCFEGHFPAHPILPGVAQLFFIRQFAKSVFRDFPPVTSFKRLKFQKLVFPSCVLDLKVTRKPESAFSFTLAMNGEMCASGLVVGPQAM